MRNYLKKKQNNEILLIQRLLQFIKINNTDNTDVVSRGVVPPLYAYGPGK